MNVSFDGIEELRARYAYLSGGGESMHGDLWGSSRRISRCCQSVLIGVCVNMSWTSHVLIVALEIAAASKKTCQGHPHQVVDLHPAAVFNIDLGARRRRVAPERPDGVDGPVRRHRDDDVVPINLDLEALPRPAVRSRNPRQQQRVRGLVTTDARSASGTSKTCARARSWRCPRSSRRLGRGARASSPRGWRASASSLTVHFLPALG